MISNWPRWGSLHHAVSREASIMSAGPPKKKWQYATAVHQCRHAAGHLNAGSIIQRAEAFILMSAGAPENGGVNAN